MMMTELFWHGITSQIVKSCLQFMKQQMPTLPICPMVSMELDMLRGDFLLNFLSRWRLYVNNRCGRPKRKCQLHKEGADNHKSSEGINSRVFWDGEGNVHFTMDESTDFGKFLSSYVLLWSPQLSKLPWFYDKSTITIGHQFAFD